GGYAVDYNEPIIIKENGEIKVVKIGELIDKIIENSENIRREGILEIAKCKGIEVIAFNSNYKFKFMPVSEVSRHPVSEMFEIVVEGNKKVRVTRSHSVFTIRDNEVVPIRVDELKVGDILVLAKRITNIYTNRKLEKLINSDFIFLKIKEINKVEPTSGYAYDLTVPNAENFVAGFGGFVLHNA
uniref:Transcription initiation factor IIB,Transcription initiation factor IIB n=1 Tax=Methanocaldococcus jannaschii (strain ATCC 43067 / DSM 2661 / JAL-1 / JCM 10045 / NBRC 100440) TaxID=243232 RepID=UPI000C122A64|nr:Chain A, Transcription initiation factor IIB,Transcription initiation factor IIB [Methanocaldococcus jannaschii DSM 2661]5O9J_B Chain B, Transcription initiation factor IIB,Transcription initiation factor IIB [Methanocaldococcus jannaschii DSM 2661]